MFVGANMKHLLVVITVILLLFSCNGKIEEKKKESDLKISNEDQKKQTNLLL